ncbi:hypothetical protein [Roseitranquillus sediminis]|uniref:hypothetical protein n=1 Tax=Roseitranquillus sediminis TaxID=2809051 RepID=UPI001D0CB196|nr:hypothetical protein [Roseitranquillus sediminis]MBM9593394.1 hypothetical protein [Roseitranquillus sediminis]
MTNPQDFTELFAKLNPGFANGPAADVWKTWATFGERFSNIAIEAASKSNEIASASTNETIARLRDVTTVRDEPADYAQAVAAFSQAQIELSRRTAEAFGGVVKQAQTDTAELFTATGERVAQSVAANTDAAVSKTAAKGTRVAKAAR